MTYGPVDFLALEFDNDQLKGEILPALLELVEAQIVNVIDLVVIQKYADGTHQALEMEQLAPDTLALFDPVEVEITGAIQVEDIAAIAAEMRPESTAAVLLVENLWVIKFGEAVQRANGRVVEHVRIPFEEMNAHMEAIGEVEAEARV